jgi:gliding motility-associatede transport system auxiliary component
MLKRAFDTIGWLGTALVLAAVAVFFLKADWQPYSRWLAWGGLVCILLYTLGQWRDLARVFAGRSARLGTISAASVLVVLGILVAINYISSREHKRWDLTSTGQFTLSPQSIKVLKSLDAPLKLTVFTRESDFPAYRDRLDEYEYVSKKVSTDYVDPDKRPALARQMQIQSYGTIAIQYKGRIERVVGNSEQEVTNGIIKVVTGKERKVYFTQGHGEKDPTGTERTGYSGIAAQLTHDNYKVEKLPLAQQSAVPADASVVIVAGPKTDFLPGEIDALKAYLDKGGKVMLLLDPPQTLDSPPLTNLVALAHDWAMDVGNNIVVDVSGMGRLLGTDETVPVAVNYPSHPIVQGLDLLTAFPLARSVTPVTGGVNGRFAQAFVETSAKSWAETDLKTMLTGGKVTFDQAKGDKQGPIPIAAAASAPVAAPPGAEKPGEEAARPETRVVVFGDSDFASNLALGISGNRDLFLNAVNWLAQQENLIAIRPKEAGDRRVTMTANQQLRVMILALFLIPLFVLGSGVYAWWRRR